MKKKDNAGMSSKKKRLKRTTGKDGGQHANQERRALQYRLLHESVINYKPAPGVPTSTENLADENNRKCLMDNLQILHKERVHLLPSFNNGWPKPSFYCAGPIMCAVNLTHVKLGTVLGV